MKELYMQYLFLYEQYIGLRNNKFDSRTNIRYGNGTYSEYYYDPLNRRLKNLKSYDANGLKMHDIDYGYDGVGNILHQSNNGEYVYNGAGGPYNYHYNYDELYRLIQSEGNFESNNNGNMYYNLNMSYSPSSNITNKQLYGQTLINGGVNNIDYNRDYQYNGRPHQVTNAGENEYEWDGNGNMILRKTPHGIRYQCWDNEDRLVAVHDEGDMPQISAYLYDGGGERVWKLTGGVIQNYMNGQQIYSSGHLDKTLYASPYMVMTEKEYTKHYYIEGERICSKIGGGFQWANIPPTSTPIGFIAGDPHTCSKDLHEMVDRNTQCVGYDGDMDIRPELLPAYNNGNEYEKLQYFYHSDHLGSASFVTDGEGRVCQHIQYLPFGELFVSQRNCEFDSRYKFTAKELDNETNYTYFGARYYDSELSVWLSVDPMSDKYPSLSPYCYTADNPVVLVDPNGMIIVITGEDGEKTTYNQGMEYNGKDEFTNKIIKTLNQMNSTEIGGQVLGELVGSENQFNFTNTFAKDKDGNEVKNALSFVKSENGGGEIHAGVLMGDNMQEGQKLESIAHELFHGYQYEKGQTLNGSLATVNNEVGAYLFGRSVYYSYNRDKGFGTMPWGNGTQAGDSYENAMNYLIWAPSFNYSQYSTAVNNFKAGSSVNVSETGVPGQGFYKDFRTDTNLKNPLIKNFFPLVR